MRYAALVLAAMLALPAPAAMFKCKGKDGTPMYQDSPCPQGMELRDFQSDPATVSVVPGGPLPGASTRIAAPAKPPKASAKAKRDAAPEGNAAERRHLTPGMSEAEVFARIGTPDLKSGGGGRRSARWSYLPAPADPQTVTTVFFDYGKVVEVERKVVR